MQKVITEAKARGQRIGFVPTMGNLHDGHLALIQQAKQTCDFVVASIYVNRLQFGLNEDWDSYPRTLEADAAKLSAVGCDLLFAPDEAEIYPNGLDNQTKVIVPCMTDVLCGASRPGHFEGVTTVVCKLFHMVRPDEAVFGMKDYQQLAVIRRMVSDLCLGVEITGAPIHRELDGLAMSSRNGFLSSDERPRVVVLQQTLQWLRAQIEAGERDFLALQAQGAAKIEEAGFKVDYLSIYNSHTLEMAAQDDAEITILGAMYTAKARLIDNLSIVIAN